MKACSFAIWEKGIAFEFKRTHRFLKKFKKNPDGETPGIRFKNTVRIMECSLT